MAFCNQVGGNDELIFDGSSLVFNAQGELIAQGKWFEEDFIVVDTESRAVVQPIALEPEESIYKALMLGLRDYFYKCGFKSAVLGLSGGIDSRRHGVHRRRRARAKRTFAAFHCRRNSPRNSSLDDARMLAETLGHPIRRHPNPKRL